MEASTAAFSRAPWRLALLLPHLARLNAPLAPTDRTTLLHEPSLRTIPGLAAMTLEPGRIIDLGGAPRRAWRPLAGALHWLSWQWCFAQRALQHALSALVLAGLLSVCAPRMRPAALAALALHPLTFEAVGTLEGREMLVTAAATLALAWTPSRSDLGERALSAGAVATPFLLHGSLLGLALARRPGTATRERAHRDGSAAGLVLGLATLLGPGARPAPGPNAPSAVARALRGLVFPFGEPAAPGPILSWVAVVLLALAAGVAWRARARLRGAALGLAVIASGLAALALRDAAAPHLAAWPCLLGICLAAGARRGEAPSP